MRARRIVTLLLAVTLVGVVPAGTAFGATRMRVPISPGQTVSTTWEGTVLPGANTSSDCSSPQAAGVDGHEIELVVPAGTYDRVTVGGIAAVTYEGPNDLVVTLVYPDGRAISADDGFVDTDEAVTFSDPAAGRYRILACAFAGTTPQAYVGTLTLTARPLPPPLPAACVKPPRSLAFGRPSYVDTRRAGGEPSVTAHPDGTLLYAAHAGTTHFYSLEVDDPDSAAFFEEYRGQVHAYASTDHGATWGFVDRTLPPDNAPGSGFSDPDFAIDGAGQVYLSEINLVNVAVSKSTDSGRGYTLQNFFAQTVTDRQWTAAGPRDVLWIVGNPSGGGTVPGDPVGHTGHTIYRSVDGGRTFSAGVTDEGGLGDIVYDPKARTLYEAWYTGGKLQIAAFRRALDARPQVALTPSVHTIAAGVSMLSHWPAIDVDRDGNVYIAWDESGNGSREAGVWYSYSEDRGRTWRRATRVDVGPQTDIWPWIAVGDPGKVAVAWFGNDHKLPQHDAEAAGPEDHWNLYVAQTLNGLGCVGSPRPGFRVSRATPKALHSGTVCMGGTVCQAEAVDRRLGDYFTIDIDTTGAVVAAYSDTRKGGAVALPAFLRQSGGPRFSR